MTGDRSVMENAILLGMPTGPLEVNCYLVACPVSREAVVIDPGGDGPKIAAVIEEKDLRPTAIINTHGHFDHIGANAFLMSRCEGLRLYIHADDLPYLESAGGHAEHWGMPFEDSPPPTDLLAGGEELRAGSLTLDVMHTPGHSPGGVCLFMRGHVFTGDTLFCGSIGRTDLPGGDHELLISSIRTKLLGLPGGTEVLPGHGPGTTIGRERSSNPFLI